MSACKLVYCGDGASEWAFVNIKTLSMKTQSKCIHNLKQFQAWSPEWLAVNAAVSIPNQRRLSSITPDWTHIESVSITLLTYSKALPSHFHGSELPFYNTSERRRIQYPNSSTISETRTHPTICDCGVICLLVFSCHVIISLNNAIHQKIHKRLKTFKAFVC